MLFRYFTVEKRRLFLATERLSCLYIQGCAYIAKVDFCWEIRGKVGKHTFVDENYALNTKVLFTKFGSVILTFKSAISINIQNYDMISRLYVVIRRNTH